MIAVETVAVTPTPCRRGHARVLAKSGRPVCRTCYRAWVEAHRERVLELRRAWIAKNKDRIRAHHAAWRARRKAGQA